MSRSAASSALGLEIFLTALLLIGCLRRTLFLETSFTCLPVEPTSPDVFSGTYRGDAENRDLTKVISASRRCETLSHLQRVPAMKAPSA